MMGQNWDEAARRRAALNHDRGSRRLSSPVIDAERPLNARRGDDTRTTAPPVGPHDPRYAYILRSHD
jgi:hypothetical protein